MKKAIRILALALCVIMLVSLAACATGTSSTEPSSSTGTSSTESTNADKGTIGFSVYTMKYEFFQNMEKGTKAEVEALGYTYKLHDEKEDASEMVTGAQNLISEGVKALIISPFKPESLQPIVTSAKEKNIPVVVDDIGGGGTDYDVIVISDCEGGGKMAADKTVELLKAANITGKNVAIIKCETSAVYAIRRGAGYKAAIEAAGYTVVKEITANSNKDEGNTAMANILASNPDIVAVFAENDPMATGAAEVLKEKNKTDIVLIGFNGDPEALEAMKAGTMDATVAQSPEAMGKLTAQLADKLIKGETLTFDNVETREIFAQVELIDKV